MSLSVCLLTRNAERSIERAVRSVAGLAAEVIVIDTGSTDGTIPAAQALGAKVHRVPWQDDFGAAQNRALEQATGAWVLWLNPDEELLPAGCDQMADLLARPQTLAYVVRVQEMTAPAQADRIAEALLPRLFRRRSDVHFIGRLHPQFAVPLEELAQRENMQIFQADLCVRRHAYLSILTPDKIRWAVHLLELELQDRPGQLHYLIELGRNLLLLNDPKGHVVLAEATALVARAAQAPAAPTPTIGFLFEYLLTVSPDPRGSPMAFAQIRELAMRWFAKSPPVLWALAKRAFVAEAFHDAVGLLETLVRLGRTGEYDRSAPFDVAIMAEPALLNLGKCYIRLGDLDRAESCFVELMNSSSHHAQGLAGFGMVQALRQRATADPRPPSKEPPTQGV